MKVPSLFPMARHSTTMHKINGRHVLLLPSRGRVVNYHRNNPHRNELDFSHSFSSFFFPLLLLLTSFFPPPSTCFFNPPFQWFTRSTVFTRGGARWFYGNVNGWHSTLRAQHRRWRWSFAMLVISRWVYFPLERICEHVYGLLPTVSVTQTMPSSSKERRDKKTAKQKNTQTKNYIKLLN